LLPLTTLGQETRWAYSTTPPSPHGAPAQAHSSVFNLDGYQAHEHVPQVVRGSCAGDDATGNDVRCLAMLLLLLRAAAEEDSASVSLPVTFLPAVAQHDRIGPQCSDYRVPPSWSISDAQMNALVRESRAALTAGRL